MLVFGTRPEAIKMAPVIAAMRSHPNLTPLVVATTQPEDIAAYAQRVADQWKIGRREVGDGVLVVVAKDERKLRIEVAKALDVAMTGKAYFAGERFSAADVILGSILNWASQMDLLEDYPDLKSYAHYLTSRSAYKKAAAGARPRFQLKTL